MKKYFAILIVFFLATSVISFASASSGTVDPVNKYAKLLSDGSWLNFNTSYGSVSVGDSVLGGYAWGEDVGWINLSPMYGGVHNTTEGVLSGYAWGEKAGWINFKPSNGGVTIDASGIFHGYAWSQNFGWISFNCADDGSCSTLDYKVATDWRPGQGSASQSSENPGGQPAVPPASIPPVEIPKAPKEVQIPAPSASLEPAAPPLAPDNSVAPVETSTGSGSWQFTALPLAGDVSQSVQPAQKKPEANNYQPEINNYQAQPVVVNKNNSFKISADTVISKAKIIYDTAVNSAKPAVEIAKIGIESPVGSVTTKIISTAGVVAGGVTVVSAAVFTDSILLSELQFLPLRILSLLLGAFGLRKRKRPWGTVYDSVTKRPLDPAYVALLDSATGKEVNSAITDLDGRYGFMVPPGRYRIVANKTNYGFPSDKIRDWPFDEVYGNLYFGEDITVTGTNQVIIKNIPMDPLAFDWNEFAKKKQKLNVFMKDKDILWARISGRLFWIGSALTLITLIFAPVPYNFIILGMYILVYLLNLASHGSKKVGFLREKTTKLPLSFAIVRIFRVGQETEVLKRVADKFGKYFCILQNGKYYVKIDRKNDDASYSSVFLSREIEVKNGILNASFDI